MFARINYVDMWIAIAFAAGFLFLVLVLSGPLVRAIKAHKPTRISKVKKVEEIDGGVFVLSGILGTILHFSLWFSAPKDIMIFWPLLVVPFVVSCII